MWINSTDHGIENSYFKSSEISDSNNKARIWLLLFLGMPLLTHTWSGEKLWCVLLLIVSKLTLTFKEVYTVGLKNKDEINAF